VRELVGQGKPFYSSLDKAAGLLRRKVGTGSEFLKELMSIPGVKQAEIAERGLGELLNAPKMTHEQFMAALGEKPAPAIGEKVLGEGPDPRDVIRAANAHARTSALNYAESADTSREAREMRVDELRRLRENHRPQMMEFARSELEDTNLPHHEQYTLPGGKNYREMLIKAPLPKTIKDAKEWFPGVPAHFNHEPGILASMRLKDRMVDQPAEIRHVAFNNNSGHPTPDFATPEELDAYIKTLPANIQSFLVKKQAQIAKPPLKLLHLEELQSDWHQQGREKGYRGNQKRIDWNDPEYIAARKRAMELNNEFNRNSHRPDRQAEIQPLMEEANRVERSIIDNNNKVGNLVPDAPFKKNWEEMALKRLIHHAAENGYHGVVVTPGAEQADRYSLAQHIDRIELQPNEFPNKDTHPYYFVAFDKNQRRVTDDTVTPEKLEGHIGKELANRLLSMEPNKQGERYLDNANLVTGGEGMKGFYDKKVPNILNSIGKKYGVKTELGGISLQTKPEKIKTTSDGRTTLPAETANLHHFPITEEMRQDVKKNGIPLYESGGSVSTQ